MKIRPTFSPLVLLVFLLSACGASAAPTEEAPLSNIYTAAASTLAAQDSLSTPTATATTVPTLTPFTLSTTVPVTATSQSTISYSYASASTANGCNNALYVSDVTIADGTVLAPGESFTKTWRFQNTGTCAWNEYYQLTFVSGTAMDGETTGIDQDVEMGSTGDISVSLEAPDSDGTYTGYWRLADENGNAFGQSVYVMVVVSSDASTVTLTPTSTTEETATLEPTTTSVPTSTAVPTSIPTETVTPVPTEVSQ
jgi:hypothetical protein